MDKYRPCPSIIAMFTSDSQHPPRSRHAVYLGETAHPCNLNLIGAVINHFMARVTNKMVPHRKKYFAFRGLVSFKILMTSNYVVCRRVASCGHFTRDSLQHYSLYICIIASIRSRHLVIICLKTSLSNMTL